MLEILPLFLYEVQEDSSVAEGGLLRGVEVRLEGGAEVGFGEVGVEGFAAT